MTNIRKMLATNLSKEQVDQNTNLAKNRALERLKAANNFILFTTTLATPSEKDKKELLLQVTSSITGKGSKEAAKIYYEFFQAMETLREELLQHLRKLALLNEQEE